MQYVPYQNGVFRKALPDTQGVPSGAILHFLRTMETHQVDIQSLYIFCNGYELVGANRKPYTADTPRRIYSAAKALTGLAVLFAVQEGLLSLDTRIAELFPEQVPEVDSEVQKRRIEMLTIRHLMTMTTGHDRDTFRPILNGTRSVEAFLQEPLDFEPGTHFLYNNGVPHILGMAVERTAGMNYIEYLRPRLLEPLKIFCTVEKTEKGELEGSRTVCTAEGFAKLTLFYLQEGMWNGQKLLDPALVRAAGSYQVPSGRCSSISFMHEDQFAGYGYKVWRNTREGYRLDGGRSQFGFIFPEKSLAIVCNAIEEDSGLIPRILWETMYPAIAEADAEAASCEGYQALNEYLQAWSCSPHLAGHPYQRDGYYDCQYKLEENPYGIKALSLHWENEKNEMQKTNEANENLPEITLIAENGTACTVRCGLRGEWEENEAFPPMPRENDRLNQIFGITKPVYRVSGGWASDFCFVFQVRASDWMDYHTFYCRFNGDRLSLSIESNMEKLSHIRKRIPMKPREYTDRPIEGIRNLQNV